MSCSRSAARSVAIRFDWRLSLDWNTVDLAIALSAAFFSSILGALSGFGAGILVMPFLVPLVGIKGVVPVMAVAMMIANIARVWVYRAHVRLDLLGTLTVSVIPGVFIGTYIYKIMPVNFLAVFIGLFLFASIALRRLLSGRSIELGRGRLIAGGFFFWGPYRQHARCRCVVDCHPVGNGTWRTGTGWHRCRPWHSDLFRENRYVFHIRLDKRARIDAWYRDRVSHIPWRLCGALDDHPAISCRSCIDHRSHDFVCRCIILMACLVNVTADLSAP